MSLATRVNGTLGRVFYGYWIMAAGSVLQALSNGFLWYGFTVFFLPLSRDLGLSRAQVSLIYGAARIEGGVEGPIVGRLIDRFGPRVMILIGTSLTGIGFLLLPQANSFLTFFVIYVLIISTGQSMGFFHPISTAINSWFIRRRATGIAMLSSVGSLGGVVLVPLLSYIVLNFGWRPAALVAGLTILAIGVPLSFVFHSSPESRGLHPDGQPPGANNHNNSHGPGVDFTVRQAVRTLSYWLLMLSITLRMAATTALMAHMIPILVWKGVDEGRAAYLVGLFAMATIATPLLFGWMGDRWSKSLLSAVGIVGGMVGVVLLLISQAPATLYLFALSMAVVQGITPLNWALIGDYFGRKTYATLRGVMGMLFGVATFITPIYAGWVYDRTQSYTQALITFLVVMVLSALLFAILRPPAPPPGEKLTQVTLPFSPS